MAHSIQTFKGKSEVINDLDLFVVIGFALTTIELSEQFESLKSLATEWRKVPSLYGPGCIDLNIENLVVTPTQRMEFAMLLEAILRQTSRSFPKGIPVDVLNKV